MTSRPGQPQLATRCRLLLFRPVLNIPWCLRGHIKGPEDPDNRYTGLSGTKRSWLPYHRDIYIIFSSSFDTVSKSDIGL